MRGEYDIIPILPPFHVNLVKIDETAYDEYKKVCEKIKKMKYVGYADDAIVYGETKEKVIEKLKELYSSVDECKNKWYNINVIGTVKGDIHDL